MRFKRKVYDELLEWKKVSNGRSAVMIQGARRVGKSTVVEEFAKSQYKSYIFIDFVETDDKIKEMFTRNKANLNMFFSLLQLETRVTLYERQSAIIFDEVQAFPLAREMIKVLVKDGRYDYLETGSLITVKSKASGIRLPSEEHKINMYPMDFEEWLWANGDTVTENMLRDNGSKMEPLGDMGHKIALGKYLEYLVIGGMPQVVSVYLEHHDILETERVKNDILNLYRDDIHRIPESASGRAMGLFNSVPGMLSSPHKVLSATKVEKGSRKRDYDSSIEWLCDAMLFNRCRCSSDPGVAIALNEDTQRLKCYLLDTGLLVSLAFSNDPAGLAEAYRLLLDGKLSINRGMFLENAVAQELVAKGYELWFTEFEKKGSVRKYEVDFILPRSSKILPLEVKSGRSSIHVSLDALMAKYRERIDEAFVVHMKDLRVDGNITYVPVYMLPFIL